MSDINVASMSDSELEGWARYWIGHAGRLSNLLKRREKSLASMLAADYILNKEYDLMLAATDRARARWDLVDQRSLAAYEETVDEQARESRWDIDELKERDPELQTMGQIFQTMREEITKFKALVMEARTRYCELTGREMVLPV